MDVELGKLIEKLKAEGVEEGRRQGRERLEAAEKEAAALLESARAEAEAADAEVVRCTSRLNVLLGRGHDAPLAPSDRLEDQATGGPGEGAPRTAFERPDVAALGHEVRAAEADARAAALATAPDLALQARAERIDGDRGVALVLNLPLVDWGLARAARRSADLQRRALALQVDQARRVASAEAQSAAAEEARRARMAARYRDDVVGRSETLEALAVKGYERGATSYLEVLEARRASKEARLAYVSLLADLARARSRRAWAEGRLTIDSGTWEVNQ